MHSGNEIPSRVAFWRNDNDIHTAAITHSTTVTERVHKRRAPIVEKACESLQNPNPNELQEHAANLSRLLVLSDLSDVLKRSESLVIEVDRDLARVQWELLPAGIHGDPLGIARPLARQLRTFYSPRPVELDTPQRLKALVIGDPGGPGYALEAAREEAIAVEKILKSHNVETELMVGAPEDGTGRRLEQFTCGGLLRGCFVVAQRRVRHCPFQRARYFRLRSGRSNRMGFQRRRRVNSPRA